MIDLELMEVLLESAKVIVYFLSFILVLKLMKKIYGGRFTNIIPPLAAGITLLMAQSALALITQLFFERVRHLDSFEFGSQMLQLVAGILFVAALYQMYQISYATTGFFEEVPQKISQKTKLK